MYKISTVFSDGKGDDVSILYAQGNRIVRDAMIAVQEVTSGESVPTTPLLSQLFASSFILGASASDTGGAACYGVSTQQVVGERSALGSAELSLRG